MSTKMIVLISSDGKTFEVEQTVAEQSQTIKQMIKDECANTSIPLPNVTGKILAKVIEYCKRHVADATMLSDVEQSAELKNFDAEFMKVNQETLFGLILAAKFLDINSLLNLTCQTVADMIKHKTPEEICKTFNIKTGLKPEEEENTSQGYAWAFE